MTWWLDDSVLEEAGAQNPPGSAPQGSLLRLSFLTGEMRKPTELRSYFDELMHVKPWAEHRALGGALPPPL